MEISVRNKVQKMKLFKSSHLQAHLKAAQTHTEPKLLKELAKPSQEKIVSKKSPPLKNKKR